MKYKCVCQTFKTNTTNRCKNRSFPFCYWFINGSTAIWTLFIMHFFNLIQKIQMTELTEWPTKHSHKSQRVAKTNTILFRLTFVKKLWTMNRKFNFNIYLWKQIAHTHHRRKWSEGKKSNTVWVIFFSHSIHNNSRLLIWFNKKTHTFNQILPNLFGLTLPRPKIIQ